MCAQRCRSIACRIYLKHILQLERHTVVLTVVSRLEHAGKKEVLPYQCGASEPENRQSVSEMNRLKCGDGKRTTSRRVPIVYVDECTRAVEHDILLDCVLAGERTQYVAALFGVEANMMDEISLNGAPSRLRARPSIDPMT